MLYIWDINTTEKLKFRTPTILKKSRRMRQQHRFSGISFFKIIQAFKNRIILFADPLEEVALYATVSGY